MSNTDLSSIKLCYATPSLGMHPTHSLSLKLSAIATAGFQGCELGFDDLLSFAQDFLKHPKLTADEYEKICVAAAEIKNLCSELKLVILVLQPFSNFEGYPQGSGKRKAAFDKAKGWMKIMDALGCGMLQVRILYSIHQMIRLKH